MAISRQSAGKPSAREPEAPQDARSDATLHALMLEPFTIQRPARRSTLFVFASPHSGRLYPPSFACASRLDSVALRNSEDAFVEELFGCAPALGAPLIAARFPRAFVDVNRAPEEIDPTMFDAAPALAVGPRTARIAAGLGVIPRVVREGMEIYNRSLPAGEAGFRLAAFYRPYHAGLARLVGETAARFDAAVVVDCHSMPASARAPDIVIGDRYGAAAAPGLAVHALAALRAAGFSVACNVPYAGGHTTALYGKPAQGLHALQIEVNRALYLDEERMEKRPGFAACKAGLEVFLARLIAADPAMLAAASDPRRSESA